MRSTCVVKLKKKNLTFSDGIYFFYFVTLIILFDLGFYIISKIYMYIQSFSDK